MNARLDTFVSALARQRYIVTATEDDKALNRYRFLEDVLRDTVVYNASSEWRFLNIENLVTVLSDRSKLSHSEYKAVVYLCQYLEAPVAWLLSKTYEGEPCDGSYLDYCEKYDKAQKTETPH